MKKLLLPVLLTTACTTTSKKDEPNTQIVQIGNENAKIKAAGLAELTKDDWQKEKAHECVTHLYQCQYDDKGQVTTVKALDQSAPSFADLSEEALRSFRFEAGKSGQCFAEFIYEKDAPTRVLLVPQDVAQTLASNLKKNRAALPTLAKPAPTPLKRAKPSIPKDLARTGRDGYAVAHIALDDEGVPTNIRIVESYPEGALDAAVISAIKKWRYASLADEPQSGRESLVTISVKFSEDGSAVSSCDLGFKLNRLAQTQVKP